MVDGIWVNGKSSKEEIAELQGLIERAVKKANRGDLPWNFRSSKITFRAWVQNNTLHIAYGWNFPPKQIWCKQVKSQNECRNCYPHGKNKDPAREVWCEKPGFASAQCPYGVGCARNPFLV